MRIWVVLAMVAWLGVPRAGHAQSESDETVILIQDARRALDGKDYDRAARLLERVLVVNPRRIDAYVLRATVYAAVGNHPAAIDVLRRARRLSPDNPDVLTTLGSELLLTAGADEGAELLEEVARRWPRRREVRAMLGHHHLRRARWTEATREFDAYFRDQGRVAAKQDSIHRHAQARALLQSGERKRALEIYTALVGANRGDLAAQFGLAWSTATVDCRRAVGLLERLEKHAPRYPDVLLVHGKCALRIDDIASAARLSVAYRQLMPHSADGWDLEGQVRGRTGDWTAARRAFEQAVRVTKDRPIFTLRLATAERRDGDPRAAIARLRDRTPPPEIQRDWLLELAESLYATAADAEVVAVLEPWLHAHPDDALAHTLSGLARLRARDFARSADHLGRALELDPESSRPRRAFAVALNHVAVTQIATGELAVAEHALTRASAMIDEPETWTNLAIVQLMRNDATAAMGSAQRAVALRRDPISLWILARAARRTNQPAVAITMLVQARQTAPDTLRTTLSLELAAAQVEANQLGEALATLAAAFGKPASAGAHELGTSYLALALRAADPALKRGQVVRAQQLLGEATQALEAVGAVVDSRLWCRLAFAAAASGQWRVAQRSLLRLEANPVCGMSSALDSVALSVVRAWTQGGIKLEDSTSSIAAMGRLELHAKGAAKQLVRAAIVDLAVRAAVGAYEQERFDLARSLLATAKRNDESNSNVRHNLAVLQLNDGDVNQALATLLAVADSIPEALVNIGIAHDRKRSPLQALTYYRRAQTAGVRYPPLGRWIETKQRLWAPDV